MRLMGEGSDDRRVTIRWPWRIERSIVALVLVALVAAMIPSPAAADVGDIGVVGPSFLGSGGTASGSKPESKLWWNDGFWWGSLWDTDTSTFHIHRLDLVTQQWIDTGVALDNRTGTRADVLWDGTKLYVASHRYSSTSTAGYPARLYRFSYNAGTKTYTLDSGYPATIHDYRVETTVIDKDSTGRLWATWTRGGQVYVSHTNGADNDLGDALRHARPGHAPSMPTTSRRSSPSTRRPARVGSA